MPCVAMGASRAPFLDFDIMTSITEITVASGERCRVEGEAKDVERLILDAARGSLMQLAWMTDAATGEPLAINPECVVMLRALAPSRSTDQPVRGGMPGGTGSSP